MTDQTTTVDELRSQVAEFVAARQWEPFHTPKNLSMSLAIEAAELMEHFQWISGEAADQVAEEGGADADYDALPEEQTRATQCIIL